MKNPPTFDGNLSTKINNAVYDRGNGGFSGSFDDAGGVISKICKIHSIKTSCVKKSYRVLKLH